MHQSDAEPLPPPTGGASPAGDDAAPRTAGPPGGSGPGLSAVQADVLRRLHEGGSAVAAAEATGCSLASVTLAAAALRAHYAVRSTTEALERARRDGLV